MNDNIEKTKRYLKDVVLPEHDSHQHRQQLRREVLARIERKQTMSPRIKSWKFAALAALVCSGLAAAAVGIKIYKYRYVGTDEEGRHHVVRELEDGRGLKGWTFSNKTADSPELAVQTAEEMDLLKQHDIKELVSIREIEVNGQLDSRLLGYEYTLSDGRTIHQYEDDPETGPGTLAGERLDEARHLFRKLMGVLTCVSVDGRRFYTAADGTEISTYEQVVQGRAFLFRKVPFALSDGTEVAWSMGQLSQDGRNVLKTGDGNTAEAEQIQKDLREIAILRRQDRRELIAVDELVAKGELERRVFVYKYQLSDGRTMDMREGDEVKVTLNNQQRQEWVELRDAGSGEDLGTYEQEVEGLSFVFKRQKFVLSDGTEVTWAYGTLKGDQ